jgi:hypothetical protein
MGIIPARRFPAPFQCRPNDVAVTKPNFLIAGAGKAGTTSLHEYLAQHPDVFMSSFKEPNFFVRGYGYNDWNHYLALFRGARGEKAVGESSTGYLCSEESPAWIKSVLGHVKIILVLRNPARRAESLYWWMVREGYENAKTFTEGLSLESNRERDPDFRANCQEFFPDFLYFGSGLYAGQVRRFFETFGRQSVRIYIFEEFAKKPLAVCRDIFNFLEIDPDFEPQIAVHNEARLPASAPLQFWLRNGAPRYLCFLPSPWRRKFLGDLMALNIKLGTTPQRDPELERQLIERYRDDIRRLEQLINRELSFWFDEQAVSRAPSASDYAPVH